MTTFWFYECRFQQDCKKDKPCEGITPCSAGAVWRRHGFWNQLYVGESRRTPNIFETEIHSGYYVGTVLIELDRVGEKSPGDEYDLSLSQDEKKKRVNALVDAIQNLWTVGRQAVS